MLIDLQKPTAEAIVNIFETGQPLGAYGNVTLIKGDSGHLSYGRSQTTLASGNLYLLIKSYCEMPDAEFAVPLSQYLGRLANRDTALDTDMTFRTLLRDAGDDLVMHTVQDQFFDRIYWSPAEKDAAAMSILSALGTTVVYDSHVHGSWAQIRDLTSRKYGEPPAIREQDWITSYVSERRNWLETNPNPALHPTVYRMDTFRQIISAQNWDLVLPVTIMGVRIDQDILMARKPVRVSAHDASERILILLTPFMAGDDVKAVQRALVQAGIAVDVNGAYDGLTEVAVREFQQQKGLTVDGIVGPATRSALGI